MKILFLCTAHNSLSQRLYLDLSRRHDISIEYALSNETMQDAVTLFSPDLVICPFLTTRVPFEVYNRVMTLIIHPGPPGDVGPSALDWLLMGDNGSVDDSAQLLEALDSEPTRPGRTHWGVTVLQATEDFDAGPVWAYEQFPIDIDQPQLTKSELYRGAVTKAAVTASNAAIARVELAMEERRLSLLPSHAMTNIKPKSAYAEFSVTEQIPFQGGRTCHRSLLKASHREFDVTKHTALQISRRIRSADSQPGVLSRVFGVPLYVYGGAVDDYPSRCQQMVIPNTLTRILSIWNEAICFETRDGKGIWITHVRRPKSRNSALQPKVPAVGLLLEIGVLSADQVVSLQKKSISDWSARSRSASQDIWLDIDVDANNHRIAYLHFDFYNGAMGTDQCSRLIDAMEYILSEDTPTSRIAAIVLMGGSYFCNGIALNLTEAAHDPAQETWLNINRINDVVYYILHTFPSRGILTIAAIRGNAAAGGVALATACDIVIAGAEVVLNPAYRAIGLHGSEYHTLTYSARCGKPISDALLRAMLPMSALQAQQIGLIDYIFPSTSGEEDLDTHIRAHITLLLELNCLHQGFWKFNADLSPTSLARTRTLELAEMSKDLWSARAIRHTIRRSAFVRKTKPAQTPLRFAKHRRRPLAADVPLLLPAEEDEEESDVFDSVDHFKLSAEKALETDLRHKIRAEMTMMLESSSSPSQQRPDGPLRIPLPPPTTRKGLPQHPACGNDESEILFPCYYHPVEGPLTPPETPFESLGSAMNYCFST